MGSSKLDLSAARSVQRPFLPARAVASVRSYAAENRGEQSASPLPQGGCPPGARTAASWIASPAAARPVNVAGCPYRACAGALTVTASGNAPATTSCAGGPRLPQAESPQGLADALRLSFVGSLGFCA